MGRFTFRTQKNNSKLQIWANRLSRVYFKNSLNTLLVIFYDENANTVIASIKMLFL